MRRLLLDTNFLLDIAVAHRPDADAAEALFEAICDGKVGGTVSPTSLKDFYYVARRDMSEARRREWIALFMDAFDVVPLGADDCRRALASDESDFEDGIIRAVAERSGCDAIVSRDTAAFVGSPARRVTASEYLAELR